MRKDNIPYMRKYNKEVDMNLDSQDWEQSLRYCNPPTVYSTLKLLRKILTRVASKQKKLQRKNANLYLNMN